jgi:hypothetical protein
VKGSLRFVTSAMDKSLREARQGPAVAGSGSNDVPEAEPDDANAHRPITEAVACEIELVAPKRAESAAEILLAQLAAEGVSATEAVAQVRRRFFLEVDDDWETLLSQLSDRPDATRTLGELVAREVTTRIPREQTWLRVHARMRCAALAGGLRGLLEHRYADRSPSIAKHAVCVRAWREVYAEHLERESPIGRFAAERLPESVIERHRAEVAHQMRFIELIDLRTPNSNEVLRAMGPRERGRFTLLRKPDAPRRPPWARKHRPIGKLNRKPLAPGLTDAQERELVKVLRLLNEAVPRAKEQMLSTDPLWGDRITLMSKGQGDALSEADRSRALFKLNRALQPAGFVLGTRIDAPEDFLGARHVFPPGTVHAVHDLGERQFTLLDGEIAGLSLREIADRIDCVWPAAAASEADWTEVEALLAELREVRRIVRGSSDLLFEGDPFSRLPTGLPRRFAKARSAARREETAAEAVALFEYGRVIVLPPDAVSLEALARRHGNYADEVPAPLNKVKVGQWFYLPRGVHARMEPDV